ncbi:hypothetical protein NN561_010567 [Cricetulus griseus]
MDGSCLHASLRNRKERLCLSPPKRVCQPRLARPCCRAPAIAFSQRLPPRAIFALRLPHPAPAHFLVTVSLRAPLFSKLLWPRTASTTCFAYLEPRAKITLVRRALAPQSLNTESLLRRCGERDVSNQGGGDNI